MRTVTSTLTVNRAEAEIRHRNAWVALVLSLGVHVADEALTGFLEFYNPLIRSMRERLGWFPMPEFTFGVWLTGLILAVLLLLALTPAVRSGVRGTVALSWFLSVLMFMNGIAHLAGSAYFGWWVPGATSAPLLLLTAFSLARATYSRIRSPKV